MTSANHTLLTSDGERLESLWDRPAGQAIGTVVLCHPHPLQGGTMRAPLMNHVAEGLASRGFTVLRFNFRGVGESSGTHGYGQAEIADVSAAWEAVNEEATGPYVLGGWSFGAATSLVWMAHTNTAVPWAGIAPPVTGTRSPTLPLLLPAAPRTFILGDRDQFTTVAETEAYIDQVSGQLHVIKGSDHFFYFRETVVTDLMAGAFGWHPGGQSPGA